MIRSVKGVELNQTEYIKEAGLYRFKVEKVGFDGYDNQGDEVPKLTFSCLQVIKKDGAPALGTTVFTHEEKYSGNENLLWKSKVLQDAMKAPEVFDFNDLQGHYVMADVSLREHNGKMYAQVSKLSYSKANDALDAIPEPKVQQQEAPASYAPVPEAIEEISSDELPF
jgi:hypothetical protein